MTKTPMAMKMCIRLQWISRAVYAIMVLRGGEKPTNIRREERMSMKNEKALQEFMAKMAQAQELLAELQTHVDNHMEFSPDEINWGHTGSAGHMVQQLSELADWAFQRGEYAE